MNYGYKSRYFLYSLALLLLWAFLHKHSNPVKSNFNADNAFILMVNDGDTLLVKQGNDKLHVRLIGIDAPESYDNAKAERDSDQSPDKLKSIINAGKRSSLYLKNILHKGDTVKLKYDKAKFDKYHRVLAYVYLTDGTFLNEKIVKDGFAIPMPDGKDLEHSREIQQAFRYARDNKLGLWKSL